MIKILSFPSRHPYMSKFHKKKCLEFVNPNTDYFNNIGGEATPLFLDKKHKLDSYDLVHIHFSFDKLSYKELNGLLDYFKKIINQLCGLVIVELVREKKISAKENYKNYSLKNLTES